MAVVGRGCCGEHKHREIKGQSYLQRSVHGCRWTAGCCGEHKHREIKGAHHTLSRPARLLYRGVLLMAVVGRLDAVVSINTER